MKKETLNYNGIFGELKYPENHDKNNRPLINTIDNQGVSKLVYDKPNPLLAIVERIGEKKVRCIVSLRGFLLPVAFPREVIDHYQLLVGDEFNWYSTKRFPPEVRIEDIEPIDKLNLWTEEDERRLNQLLKDSEWFDNMRSLEESLLAKEEKINLK